MTLSELLQYPESKRDYNWESHFFDELLKSKVKLLDEGPQMGPDNWPYLLVETGEGGDEPLINIVKWLSDKGIGLVVNPRKEYPDYVFPWGMIWNFRETGLFRLNTTTVMGGKVELHTKEGLHAGPPTAEYLPDYVRALLKQFFRDQGLLQARVLMVSQDRKHYDLVFSLESLGNPPERERAGIAEAISWFLPAHYSIMLASEKGLPAFVAL